VPIEFIVPHKKVILAQISHGCLILGCSKTLKNIFHMLNNTNEPIKPKISSTEDSYREKTMIFVEKITKRHLGNLRHFEIFNICLNKNRWYI
jgi:hypothetical protein